MTIWKTPDADPTCDGYFETHTLTINPSSGTTLTFDSPFESQVDVIVTPINSQSTVTVSGSGFNTRLIEVGSPSDIDVNVLVVGE